MLIVDKRLMEDSIELLPCSFYGEERWKIELACLL